MRIHSHYATYTDAILQHSRGWKLGRGTFQGIIVVLRIEEEGKAKIVSTNKVYFYPDTLIMNGWTQQNSGCYSPFLDDAHGDLLSFEEFYTSLLNLIFFMCYINFEMALTVLSHCLNILNVVNMYRFL